MSVVLEAAEEVALCFELEPAAGGAASEQYLRMWRWGALEPAAESVLVPKSEPPKERALELAELSDLHFSVRCSRSGLRQAIA